MSNKEFAPNSVFTVEHVESGLRHPLPDLNRPDASFTAES
jgi:hypothetical protein